MKKNPKGVFCLEGDWWNDLRQPSTVEPILQLLEVALGFAVPYVHRNVDTEPALKYYLSKWTQKKYKNYPILYMAFHGDKGKLFIGDGRRPENCITLDWLASRLEGKCAGKIILLGSCDTLNIHGKRLNTFLKRTHALAICGYSTSVNWLTSTAFELLAFGEMQTNKKLTLASANAIKSRIKKRLGSMAKALKFRMVVRKSI